MSIDNPSSTDRENLVRQCMRQFDRFFLKKYSEKSIESCFRYLLNGSSLSAKVLYNFKLFGSEEQCTAFADSFADAMRLIEPDYQVYQVHEQQLLTKFPDSLPKAEHYGLFIRCDSSEELSDNELKKWNRVIQQFEESPETIHFLFSPSDSLKNRFRNSNSHLYYRVFPCDVVFAEPDADGILSLFTDEITDSGLMMNDDFASGLQQYVEIVYPDADKRGYDFLEDLEGRVIRLYNEKPADGILDAGCVPYSRKIADLNATDTSVEKKTAPEDNDSNDTETAALIPSADQHVEAAEEPKASSEAKTQEVVAGEGSQEAEEEPEPLIVQAYSDEVSSSPCPALDSNDVKRILVLALSTFHQNRDKSVALETNEYHYGKSVIVHGAYQLEPIPALLRHMNKFPDKIIVFATPDTMERSTNIRLDGKKVISSEDPGQGVSPLEYFMHCVNAVQPTQFEVIRLANNDTSIDPKNISIVESIRKALNALQVPDEKGQGHQQEIFVDIHGGPRDTQQIVSGLLYLAGVEGIKINPENVYSADYYFKEGYGVIRNSGETLHIFDFVSGMNELVNDGRVVMLKGINAPSKPVAPPTAAGYQPIVKKQKKNRTASSDSTDGITDAQIVSSLNTIAESIQLCNIYAFEKGLSDLAGKLAQYESAGNKAEKGYLSLYLKKIRDDYSAVIAPNHTVLDEIEWCLQKGFYQQMLTLIESKMPSFLSQKQPGCQNPMIACDQDVRNYALIKIAKDNGIPQKIRDNPTEGDLTSWIINKVLINSIYKGDRLKAYSPTSNAAIRNSWTPRKDDKTDRSMPDVFYFMINQCMNTILRQHYAAKELRNHTNHGDATDNLNGIHIDNIETGVHAYMNAVRNILRQPASLEAGPLVYISAKKPR